MRKLNFYLERIDQILGQVFFQYTQKIKEPVAVLVSGGIDSSVIASWVKKTFSSFELFSLISSVSQDQAYGEILGRWLKVDLNWVDLNKISKVRLKKIIVRLNELLLSVDIEPNLMQLSLAAGCWLLFEEIKKKKIKVVFSGQGPDVLLAGYHRYRQVKNLNRAIKNDLPSLEIDRRREKVVADVFGLNLIYPYLEKNFIDFALKVPAKYKYYQGKEKYLLRQYGKKMGLPQEIFLRPKKAFQYSTGLQKIIKNLMPGLKKSSNQ